MVPLSFTSVPQKRYRWERASETTPKYCQFSYENPFVLLAISYGYRFPFYRDYCSNAPCDAETQNARRFPTRAGTR
ncbi:MAG: hypothetical protein J6K20_03410 [Thermoguttaceae bacterium]|nr:hypothetical protein [Thermoguttaceae bacterium]